MRLTHWDSTSSTPAAARAAGINPPFHGRTYSCDGACTCARRARACVCTAVALSGRAACMPPPCVTPTPRTIVPSPGHHTAPSPDRAPRRRRRRLRGVPGPVHRGRACRRRPRMHRGCGAGRDGHRVCRRQQPQLQLHRQLRELGHSLSPTCAARVWVLCCVGIGCVPMLYAVHRYLCRAIDHVIFGRGGSGEVFTSFQNGLQADGRSA